MKVFISCDIEGTALTTIWDECYPQTMSTSSLAGKQHTAEVKAACEGAINAGASEIVVKDAHNTCTHLNVAELPRGVKVVRGSCGSPMGMIYGLDETFDAAMFVGYHSAAGSIGNPLSHTETKNTVWVKLNGQKCSEFVLYSLAARMKGVPSVFLSGDKMLIEDSRDMHPKIQTVAVKDGFGGTTTALHPEDACDLIREGAEKALRQELRDALCEMPKSFVFEICFKETVQAVAKSFYPGFELAENNVIRMKTDNFEDILRCISFVF